MWIGMVLNIARVLSKAKHAYVDIIIKVEAILHPVGETLRKIIKEANVKEIVAISLGYFTLRPIECFNSFIDSRSNIWFYSFVGTLLLF